MKKLVLFAWVSCMLLVPGLIARSGFLYLPASYIPENVQWVLHVDMKRLRAAEVGALLEDKHLDWVTEVNQEMIDEFRINLVDKTTGITVFGTHRERRNSVMLLSGDFDRKFGRL